MGTELDSVDCNQQLYLPIVFPLNCRDIYESLYIPAVYVYMHVCMCVFVCVYVCVCVCFVCMCVCVCVVCVCVFINGMRTRVRCCMCSDKILQNISLLL